MGNKKQLRQEFIKARKSLPEQEWQDKSRALCQWLNQYLKNSPALGNGGTILTYLHFRQEPNLDPLFNLRDYRWAIPRCVENDLSWHFWQSGDALVKGAFGIREPLASAPICAPDTVDLILVPAVACDRRGYRLGYGGGFYDRLFEQPQWREIPKVGIIFDFAFVSEVPADPWDVPLDGVCTDWGWRVAMNNE